MAAERELLSLLNDARTVSALTGHYERVVQRIIEALAVGISKPGAARARELVARVNELIDQLDPRKASVVREWIAKRIPEAYVLGDEAATRQLQEQLRAASSEKRLAEGGIGGVNTTWTAVNQTAMQGITAAMREDLSNGASQMRRLIGTTVRETQLQLLTSVPDASAKLRDLTVQGYIRGSAGRQIADDMAAVLLGNKVTPDVKTRLNSMGFHGDLFEKFERIARGEMIQVGKVTMSVRAYADLVARTQMTEAHKIGTIVRLQKNGIDHVRISKHVMPKPDQCTLYAGKVFYVGPQPVDPAGFPRLADILNGGPPWHPNCKHVLQPFVIPLKSEEGIAEARKSSAMIPPGAFQQSTKEVGDFVKSLTDDELKSVAAEGFEDIAA